MSSNINKPIGLAGEGSSDSISLKLQHREEICLSAFVDGECGWIKSFFAKRRLQKSFEARKFVDDLERTSTEIQHSYAPEVERVSKDLSLWPKISARIEQEERLTLLRSIPIESPNPFSWAARLSWGGLGAVAASAIFLLNLPNIHISQSKALSEAQQFAETSRIFATGSAPMADVRVVVADGLEDIKRFEESRGLQVQIPEENLFERPSRLSDADYRALHLAAMQGNRSFGSGYSQDRNAWKFIQQEPQFIDTDESQGLSLPNHRKVIAPQAFEVDWVRSNGRVSLLQDSTGKSAMLWVNRPQSAQPVPRAQARSPNIVQVGNRQ